jgi:hypothetical protein
LNHILPRNKLKSWRKILAVVASDRAKNIQTGRLKNVNYLLLKKWFESSSSANNFHINQIFFAQIVQNMQNTRQRSAILEFECAAKMFQLLRTWAFNRCEKSIFLIPSMA